MVRLLLLVFGVTSCCLAQDHQLLEEFCNGYNDLTADIYKELSKVNQGNFLVCPLSVDIILALTESGAQGQTAKELTSVLHLPDNRQIIHNMFRSIAPYLQSTENYTLQSANKVYVKTGFSISDQFKRIATDVFSAEIQNIDFAQNHVAAVEINQWVEQKTHDKIKNLIQPSMLNKDTRTVLVNAIYFHGKWMRAFDVRNTIKYPFHVTKEHSMDIDVMSKLDQFEYYECSDLNAKFLKLDYQGGDVSMHIVLPNDIDGLEALEGDMKMVLTPPEYQRQKVSVLIPKFKIETDIQFKPILQMLGVRTAFENHANFHGVGADEDDLKISDILQKTYIEVEEEGTTAAASTAVLQFVVTSIGPKHKLFHANHPFLFYLRLNKLGVNFFVGRYKSP